MSINETLAHIRGIYRNHSLDVGDCSADPEVQFNQWFNEAVKASCDEPNAFTLSTVVENKPRARVVLLKGLEKNQFVFYTNYLSLKGIEMEHNAHVALTFLWLPLHRQVRIEGIVTKISPIDSDNYFKKRPRGSQLGAVASPQSQKIANRKVLEDRFKEIEAKFPEDIEVNRPVHWGGYAVTPTYFEFWQGRDNRLHDRIVYNRENGKWVLGRLAP